jgi:ATP:corrinoid adenosyltransferase
MNLQGCGGEEKGRNTHALASPGQAGLGQVWHGDGRGRTTCA